VLAGEPALTVVPNLAFSGILAVLMSLLVAAWASVAVRRRHGGLVLVGLCGVLLVVRGGFGPPLLGAVLGLTLTLAQRRASRSTRDARLARWWPWLLLLATASFSDSSREPSCWVSSPALTPPGRSQPWPWWASLPRSSPSSPPGPETTSAIHGRRTPVGRGPTREESTMLTGDQPTKTAARRRRPASWVRTVLLACGIGYALLYGLGHDLVAALLWPDYRPVDQAISELTSPGAPTRATILVLEMGAAALLVAFGIGVVGSAAGHRALRLVGALIIALGASGPLWLPFPMSARGDITGSTTALTDVMHLVLGAATVLLTVGMIGFGARALAGWFRVYSLVSLAVVLGCGVVTFVFVPRVAAGQSTLGMGIVERLSIGTWLIWLATLAVVLLRGARRRPDVDGPGRF
jgi:hypothetical protein